MRYILSLASLAICLAAWGCGGPGPLTNPTLTPQATSTSIPTATAAPMDTPTSVPTETSIATATATQMAAPTAAICPKGTVLLPSVNRCFYATRTPKPESPFCEQFKKASDCVSNGCSWNKKVGFCS